MGKKKDRLKEKGENFLKDGCGLIDTSYRTRDVNKKSVLALASKNINFTISMDSKEKKKIFKKLIKKHKKDSVVYTIMHSVKLYYALHRNVPLLPSIYVCSDGLNVGKVKHYLKLLLKEDYNENKINILPSLKPLFGKRNIADRLAYKIRVKNQTPTMELEEKHFKRLDVLQ